MYTSYVTKDDNEQKAYITAYNTSGWAEGSEYASFLVLNTSSKTMTNLCRIMYAGNYSTTYKIKGNAGSSYRMVGFYELENPYNYMNISGVWCP